MINVSWPTIKAFVTQRGLNVQFVLVDDVYHLWAFDGPMAFSCVLPVTDPAGVEQSEFETHFKDHGNKKIQVTNDAGLPRVHSSPRPENMTTYFTGAGDTEEISGGDELLFDLSSSDVSKSVDIGFNEDVWFKDGFIWSSATVPFGAYINTEIVHPQAGVVGSFGRKIFLIPDWVQPLDTEDSGLIPAGLKIRITVFNSGTHSAPAAFKALGRLEIYRAVQV